MLKKVAVVGLVLLLAGTAALSWVLADRKRTQQEAAFYKLKYGSELKECLNQYNKWLQLSPEERTQAPLDVGGNWKTKTEAQLQQEQQGRLKADLDRLAAGEKDVYPFADFLYGRNWQKEVSDYKNRQERNEFILTASIVCVSAGGTLFVCCLLLWVARIIIRELSCLWEFLAGIFMARRESEDEPPAQQKQESHTRRFEKRSKVLVNSGWQSFAANSTNHPEPAPLQTEASIEGELYSDDSATVHAREHAGNYSAGGHRGITALLSGQETITSQTPLIKTEKRKTAPPASSKNVLRMEDSLKTQTEKPEKQMAEVKQMTESVQQATLGHSKPLDSVLRELTQQVGAIREYAAGQQEKVKRLQDGYDWNIIKSFCLRIIRCIDNLESRIARLSEQDVETVHLKEVRDEMVFLLESSGVEQFEPEVNSDYHGQEKLAEAVKEKEYCYDRNLVGKIAQVIRAGYQYFIDDENFKVVRPAQVKLFG